VAREFVSWLDQPLGLRWLDVGSGTGMLSRVVIEDAAPSEILGVDRSETFVRFAQERVVDPVARFQVGDAGALPVESDQFDVAVSGLVLNHVPDPVAMLAEMARAVRPDGTVALYVWDYAEGMQMFRRFWDAATSLDPSAAAHDHGTKSASICHPDRLTERFEAAGLRGVSTRAIDIPMVFTDFDDYWVPLMPSGSGPAPAYLSGLSEEQRIAIRERLRATLPTTADGSISLSARAWAVRGRR